MKDKSEKIKRYNNLQIKILMVGSKETGKYSLVNKYAYDFSPEDYEKSSYAKHGVDLYAKHGVDFKLAYVESTSITDPFDIRLQIWSVHCGRSIGITYCRGAQIIFICYDTTNLKSFEEAYEYYEYIMKDAYDGQIIVLCGTKNDLVYKRQVPYETASRLAKEKRLIFWECSSKTNEGVCELLFYVIDKYRDVLEQQRINKLEKEKERLRKEKEQKIKPCVIM